MRAARWDTVWEQGSLWRVVLRWRIGAGEDVVLGEFAEPSYMELFDADGEVMLTVSGVLGNDDHDLALARTSTQTEQVDAGNYWHRVRVTDPELDDLRTLLTGYVTVNPPQGGR